MTGCSGHGMLNSTTGTCLCDKSHTGAACDVARCTDDCNGRGTCAMGKCICRAEHFGAACQNQRCPADCSGRGYCFSGQCQCSGTYGGDDCLLQLHSDNVVRFGLARKTPFLKGNPLRLSSLRASSASAAEAEGGIHALSALAMRAPMESPLTMIMRDASACSNSCSGSGQCIKGACLCYAGFQGHDCGTIGACSGHGAHSNGKCSCDAGWAGADCGTELLCPDQSCSGNGICTAGKCLCGVGYSGHSCHISLISCEFRCGAHGACGADADTQCSCKEGWSGARCEIEQKSAGCPSDCNGHGTCMDSVCSCHALYEGDACESLTSLAQVLVNKTNSPSLLATHASAETRKAAAKSTVAKASSNASPSTATAAKAAPKLAPEASGSPMTASWLGPSSWVQAAAEPTTMKLEVPARPRPQSASSLEAAVTSDKIVSGDDGALWHAAVLPQVPVSRARQLPAQPDRSILNLLSTGSSKLRSRAQPTPSGQVAWAEHPLEEVKQVSHEKPADIEALLADI